MTHETTAPVQSLTDEMLDELEASTMAYMRDVADGSASPPRPYNDYAAISGESVLELIATVRQQQALIAQQGAPVAVLERA